MASSRMAPRLVLDLDHDRVSDVYLAGLSSPLEYPHRPQSRDLVTWGPRRIVPASLVRLPSPVSRYS